MTLQPDHPDFTASVLGEALPENLAAFEAAMGMDQRSLTEAAALLHTADRLRAALRQDPALKGLLTPGQRAEVLASAGAAAVPSPFAQAPAGMPGSTSSMHTANRTRSLRVPAAKKRLLFTPAAATAGIAAAVALGIFFTAGPSRDASSNPVTSSDSSPASGQPAKPRPQGITVIALDPVAVSGPPSKAGVPAPGLPVIPPKDSVILPGPPLENPMAPGSQAPAIATTPPDIRLAVPETAPAAAGNPPSRPQTNIVPVPGAPLRRGGGADTLASPGRQ